MWAAQESRPLWLSPDVGLAGVERIAGRRLWRALQLDIPRFRESRRETRGTIRHGIPPRVSVSTSRK